MQAAHGDFWGKVFMKKKVMEFLFLSCLTGLILSGCTNAAQSEDDTNDDSLITIGFSQVGAESDWRAACTNSIMEAFSEENGYNLIFSNAQQKQENQIKAVRDFISQDVDYIIIDPIAESGWDQTLKEASDVGIPVIIVDRSVDADDSLYTAAIGSDFTLEGKRACAYLKAYLDKIGYKGKVNIADIQGTTGSSATIGRTKAFDEASKKYNWNVLAQETADFTEAKGKEVMESILKRHEDINVVYCENDNEAIGAKKAIEAAGKKVGSDISNGEIILLSFDATHTGLEETLNGNILVNTECNPLYGDILSHMVKTLEEGGSLNKQTYIREEQYSKDSSIRSIRVDGKTYPVTVLDERTVEERSY